MKNEEKNITDAAVSFGALLRGPFQALARDVYGELAASGFPDIRPAHGSVFRAILPGGSRVSDLAERVGMAKQSMAYLVDDLEKTGYVSLHPDPSDRRARQVRLTEKGLAAQQMALEISGRVEGEMARRLGGADWATLRRLLERLYATLDSPDDPRHSNDAGGSQASRT